MDQSGITIDDEPLEDVADVRLLESEAYRRLAGIERLQWELSQINGRLRDVQGMIVDAIAPVDDG